MSFLTPAVKRIIGYVVVSLSGLAIAWRLAMAALGMETGASWESSVYLWVAILVALCFAITWAVPATEVDPEQSSRLRRGMILIYLAFTVGMAVIILAAHALIGRMPPPPVPAYAPVILFAAIVGYMVCYVLFIRKADYAGNGAMFALVFLMGMVAAPAGAIETFNSMTQDVEILDSGADLSKAKSDFVNFRNLALDRRRWLGYRSDWHDDKNKYRVEYRGLIPVVTNPADTIYRLWIDLHYSKEIDDDLKLSEKEILRDKFNEASRKAIQGFRLDSVVFFDQSLREGDNVLKINKYPVVKEAVLLLPRYHSLTAVGRDNLYTFLFMYVVVTLGFWGISSGWFDSDSAKERRREAEREAVNIVSGDSHES